MYVDLGRQRGRVHFSWRDLVAIGALCTTGFAYVLRTEVALADMRDKLAACQQSVRQLERAHCSQDAAPSERGE